MAAGGHQYRVRCSPNNIYFHQRPMRIHRVVSGQMQATGSLGVMVVDSGGA